MPKPIYVIFTNVFCLYQDEGECCSPAAAVLSTAHWWTNWGARFCGQWKKQPAQHLDWGERYKRHGGGAQSQVGHGDERKCKLVLAVASFVTL